LAILITSNKALTRIANFFIPITEMELTFELDTALTVKCITAVACALGLTKTKVSIALENAQLVLATALALLAITLLLFGSCPTPKK
jgi:hypothetical protein